MLLLQEYILFAQSGFLDNNPSWQVNSACQVGFPCILNKNYRYYLNGDTILSSHQYKKLFIAGTYNYYLAGPPPPLMVCQGTGTYDSLHAFIREDGLKFYQWFPNGEELLYDFDLTTGDTIPLSLINPVSGMVVDSIDTIWIANQARKKFYFSSGGPFGYMIEGLGSSFGFLEPMGILLECSYTLECYAEQDSVWFSPQGICSLIMTVPENHTEHITVFPNPVSDVLFVETDAITSWYITDGSGRVVLSGFPDGNTNRLGIEVGQLPPGFYGFNMTGKGDVPKHKSFVRM